MPRKSKSAPALLHRYRITYRCALDPGCPDFAMVVRAYDIRHAEERFFDSDDQDWTIVRIERCSDV